MNNEKLSNSINNIRSALSDAVKHGCFNMDDVAKILVDFQTIVKFIQDQLNRDLELQSKSKEITK